MEPGAAFVCQTGLREARADLWAQEIRDYLLGRLSSKTRVELLDGPQVTHFANPPVRRWWIFEGKQYGVLRGSLAQNWDWVVRNARRLVDTFNPRLRLSDRPDGVVDWGNTLARGPQQIRPEYVVRSSGIGLDEEEHAALRGWARWIADEWLEYTRRTGIKLSVDWGNFAAGVEGPFSHERLRRWAHTARRSRWPLLRGVVAESLRPVLEPEELDRIPLPADEATLFELLCLVRIARCLAPPPQDLRWIGADVGGNVIHLDGIRIFYQQSIDRHAVLATNEYAGSLAAAVGFFGVRIPKLVDLAFDFESTRAGFDGLIFEAKSGSQQYEHTIPQLRTYRAARPRRSGARYLIWGVVENPQRADASFEDLQRMFTAADQTSDVWSFSGADAIPVMLRAALGVA